MGVEQFLPQRVFQVTADGFELGARLVADLLELDHMPAELRLDGRGDLAGRKRRNGVKEGRHHVALAEPAQIAAGRGGWPDGFFLCQRGEIGAIGQLGDDLLRRFLGFHQNMRSLVFLLLGVGRVFFVIELAQGGVGDLAGQQGGNRFVGTDRAAIILDLNLAAQRQFAIEGLHQEGLLDQLIEDAAEEHLGGKLIILPRQAGAYRNDIGKRDLGAVHRCQNPVRVGRRTFLLRRAVLRCGGFLRARGGGKGEDHGHRGGDNRSERCEHEISSGHVVMDCFPGVGARTVL